MKSGTRLSLIVGGILFLSTLILFILFRPAVPSAVYYFNMVMTLGMEAVVAWLCSSGQSKNVSPAFWAVLWTVAAIYIGISFITMVVYFALVEPGVMKLIVDVTIPFSFYDWVEDNVLEMVSQIFMENGTLGRVIYFSVYVVLTAATGIVLSILWHVDAANSEEMAQLREEQTQIVDIFSEMDMLRKKYVRVCAEKGITYETQSNNTSAMDTLCNKLKFLTPNVVRNERAQGKFAQMQSEAKGLINALQMAEGEEVAKADKAVRNFVQDSVEVVDMLKQTCRS